jgi:hypothetical protein
MSQIRVVFFLAFLATLSVSNGFVTIQHQYAGLTPRMKHASVSNTRNLIVHMSGDAIGELQDVSRKAFIASSIVSILTLRQSFAESDEVRVSLPNVHKHICQQMATHHFHIPLIPDSNCHLPVSCL